MGTIYKRGKIYWIKYHHKGKEYFESSKSKVWADAANLLKQREGDAASGKPAGLRFDKVMFDELVEDFKKSVQNEQFFVEMINLDNEIKYNEALNSANRGEYEKSYKLMKDLISSDKSIPVYKEKFVNISISYAKSVVTNDRNYDLAISIMDSLVKIAPDYPIIEEAYVHIIIAPFQFEYDFVNTKTKQAFKLAHKAFKMYPKNPISISILSNVYHFMAMDAIRKNDLKKAHKILVEGLNYLPNDKLLNEDLDQVIDSL